MSIWKEESFEGKIHDEVESFFNIHELKEEDETLALDIIDSLRDKNILVVEKDDNNYGYLIPLLYASKDKETFKGFLISTATIFLQNKLKEEIDKLSKLIDVDIPVTIAKGHVNYVCMKRLEKYLRSHQENKTLNEISRKIEEEMIDKEDYPNISNEIWTNINVNGENCRKCLYKDECKYYLNRKSWPNAKYVLCTHELLVASLKRKDNPMFKDPSILIVDEASILKEKVRSSYEGYITKNMLKSIINEISYIIGDKELGEGIVKIIETFYDKLGTLIKSKYMSGDNNYKIYSNEVINTLKDDILLLFNSLSNFRKELSFYQNSVDLIHLKRLLNKYTNILYDMIGEGSKHIYCFHFQPNSKGLVSIRYERKDILELSSSLFANKKYGKVFTDSNMTVDNDDYKAFIESLGLDKIDDVEIVKEYPLGITKIKNRIKYLTSE